MDAGSKDRFSSYVIAELAAITTLLPREREAFL